MMLTQQNIKGQRGIISFDLAGIQFPVESRDIIGGVLQEWFENWMIQNNILFYKKSNTQDWPDFILSNNEHLEIKAFNYEANPGFDLANFDAYTRSLIEYPDRLDSDHLIFGYISKNKSVQIAEFWVKKIWEMTGPSPTNFLNLQVKQNNPTNIRPKDWRGKSPLFTCRRDFVLALDEALNHFNYSRYNGNWFSMIEESYQQKTNSRL